MEKWHLTADGGEWLLTAEKSDHPAKTFSTKEEAVRGAAEYLKGKTASLIIHGVDGKIQEERTYPRSADPQKSSG